jgi:O-antigen/teichoic acid export membrane protein
MKFIRLFNTQTFQYGAGYSVLVIGRMTRDLMVARILGPEIFGLWVGLVIYRQYSAYSDLGFTNGLGRVLPKNLNEGKTIEARIAMGMAWILAMSGTFLFAILVAVWFISVSRQANPVVIWGIITITGLMFLDKHFMYTSVTFRSAGRVGESGIWMGLLGALELGLGLLLTPRFGLYGLYISLIVSSAITISIMFFRQPFRCLVRFDKQLFKVLAVASVVLMGFGLTTIALHNIDRVAILYLKGAGSDLGQYHIASTMSLVVSYLPYILLSVLGPQIYRFDANNHLELKRYLLLPTALVATLSVSVVSLMWLVLPPLIQWLLPQYHSTPTLIGALMIAELFFSIAMVSDNIMVALDRGGRGLVVRSGNVLLGFMLSLWALRHGLGINGVAWSMCLVQGLGGLIIGIMAAYGTRISIGRYLLVAMGPVAYGFVIQWGLFSLWGLDTVTLRSLILKVVLCAGALFPMIIVPLGYLGIGPLASQRMKRFFFWGHVS